MRGSAARAAASARRSNATLSAPDRASDGSATAYLSASGTGRTAIGPGAAPLAAICAAVRAASSIRSSDSSSVYA